MMQVNGSVMLMEFVPTEASLKPFVRSRSLATKPIAASQGQCPLCANRDIMQGDDNKIFSLNLNP